MNEKLEKELSNSLEAANDASGKVRTQHLAFVLFMVYFSLIIAETTDKQLLLISPVNLPLINVELPLRNFFMVAPWIFVFLHFHLLIQFYLLSQKLFKFEEKLSKLKNEYNFSEWCNRLSAFSFNHLIINLQHQRSMRVVLAAIILFTMIILPLLLLLWAQVRFIPYQSEAITWSHRVVILVDVLVLGFMWPRIINTQEQVVNWWTDPMREMWRFFTVVYFTLKKRLLPSKAHISSNRQFLTSKSRHWIMIVSLSVSALFFSSFVIVIPNGWMEIRVSQAVPEHWLHEDENRSLIQNFNSKYEKFFVEEGVANNSYFSLTYWIFNLHGQPFRQYLFVRNEVLVKGAESVEIKNLLRSQDVVDQKKGLRNIEGIKLNERSLRYADLKGSILSRADLGLEVKQVKHSTFSKQFKFVGSDLRGANLVGTQLQGADLGSAQLQGANLAGAQLQGANLEGAQMQGAILANAKLQEANLTRTQLKGTNLFNIQLQGANLRGANMQWSSLQNAKMQGADLRNSRMEGVDLRNVNMQGANLGASQLQGAILANAKLQAVNLGGANLQGSDLGGVQLQGAYMAGAQLQGANLITTVGIDSGPANIQGAILLYTKFGKLDKNRLRILKYFSTSIGESAVYSFYKQRLKYSAGKKAVGVDDSNSIHCTDVINCDFKQAVKIWIDVSCESIESARSIALNFSGRSLSTSLIGKSGKYYNQFIKGLETNMCRLTKKQKHEVLEILDNVN